jgi:hypothetical protein
MSRQNKVNPSQYHVAGRLTPDDLARELVKQRNVTAPADSTPQAGKASPPARPSGARDKNAAGTPAMVQAKPRTRAAGRSRG